MRMRRKKRLDERVLACVGLFIDFEIENFNTAAGVTVGKSFDCEEIFGNSNPVHLEIGCGKGQFVLEAAKRHPNINFVAVEKLKNVIVEAAEKVMAEKIENVRFINCPAEYLNGFFHEKEIERLYLNFSCPYPKKSYAKHRLTHESFLKIYRKILCDSGEIHMKTDNQELFEFSLNSFSAFGFRLKGITHDLHNSGFEGNIVTEYEQKFTDAGLPIYRVEAY
ncbi:MAG: tRNA (guanosine(46)-N7)-methyltransferase TrmB [Oscillospiraceae bacterium]|jgi:tRNA (guanine-N7-)-methyltransferase